MGFVVVVFYNPQLYILLEHVGATKIEDTCFTLNRHKNVPAHSFISFSR